MWVAMSRYTHFIHTYTLVHIGGAGDGGGLTQRTRAEFVKERGQPRAKDRRLCPLTNPRNACIDRFWSYLGRPGVPDSPKGRCASTKMAVASINQSHSLQSLWLPSPFGPRSPCVSALFGQCSVGKGSPLPLFLLEPEDRESHATREKHPYECLYESSAEAGARGSAVYR